MTTAAPEIKLYGAEWCPDCHRSRNYLDSRSVAYEYVNVDGDEAAQAYVKQVNDNRLIIPTIVFSRRGLCWSSLQTPNWPASYGAEPRGTLIGELQELQHVPIGVLEGGYPTAPSAPAPGPG